ncbi:hypothetical protein VNO80_21079 [Phaseolus coccineus]|uniref:Uncharacterized protein n=1 Tax=Phaseolus coccineus TaxID=3886 RepID=A0AAN9M6X6_PHACN
MNRFMRVLVEHDSVMVESGPNPKTSPTADVLLVTVASLYKPSLFRPILFRSHPFLFSSRVSLSTDSLLHTHSLSPITPPLRVSSPNLAPLWILLTSPPLLRFAKSACFSSCLGSRSGPSTEESDSYLHFLLTVKRYLFGVDIVK